MKKLVKLSVIACLVTVMFGCGDKNEEAPYFKMGAQSLTQKFGSEGGTGYFTVSTNQKFTATSSESWCTVTVIDGKTEENLKIEVSPLQAITDRQATVTIACPGFTSQILTVVQTGAVVTFEVTAPNNRTSIAWRGEDVVFTVNSSETWSYEITPSSSWLTKKAEDATTLTLTAAYNSGAARDATVRFFVPAYPDVSEELDLTQVAQGEISLSVSYAGTATSYIPREGGDTETITVTTDADQWNYTAPSWLSLKAKTATTLTLTADAATLGRKIGVVTITAGDKSEQVDIVQQGLADILDLIFHEDGTATNIADPELPIITVPYEKTGQDDLDRLITVRNETYGRYIARFNRPVSTWVNTYIVSSGFYRLDCGAFISKLTDGHSFEALVTTNDLTGYSMKVMSWQGGGAGVGLTLAYKKFTFIIGSAGVTNTPEVTTGTYYHLVGTYTQGTVTLYINGTPYVYTNANATMTALADNTQQWIGIGTDTGANNMGDGGYVGDIVIARIYDTVLTAEQVAALYAEITE
jgi:hypothetical protein